MLTVFLLTVFAAGLVERQVRTQQLFYAGMTGVAGVGLWLRTGWGRALALLFGIGNAGIGALAVVAGMVAGGRFPVGAAVLAASGALVAYLVSSPLFALPSDDDG